MKSAATSNCFTVLYSAFDASGTLTRLLARQHFLMSNARPEIRVTTSVLTQSLTGYNFPDFKWLIGLPGITIVSVRDRLLGLRITLYLKRCNRAKAELVRKCDALNDKETYEAETFALADLAKASPDGLILVSTDLLSVGVDLDGVRLSR